MAAIITCILQCVLLQCVLGEWINLAAESDLSTGSKRTYNIQDPPTPARKTEDVLPVSWDAARLRSTLSSLLIPSSMSSSSRRSTTEASLASNAGHAENMPGAPLAISSIPDKQDYNVLSRKIGAWGLNTVEVSLHAVQHGLRSVPRKVKGLRRKLEDEVS